MGVFHRIGLRCKRRENDDGKSPEMTSNRRRGSEREQIC